MRLLHEGPDIQTLLGDIRAEHGSAARIVKAERVRTGGIAGFFAKQHFEVTLELPDTSDTPAPNLPTQRSGSPAPTITPLATAAAGSSSFEALIAAAERDDLAGTAAAEPAERPAPETKPGDAFATVLETVAAYEQRNQAASAEPETGGDLRVVETEDILQEIAGMETSLASTETAEPDVAPPAPTPQDLGLTERTILTTAATTGEPAATVSPVDRDHGLPRTMAQRARAAAVPAPPVPPQADELFTPQPDPAPAAPLPSRPAPAPQPEQSELAEPVEQAQPVVEPEQNDVAQPFVEAEPLTPAAADPLTQAAPEPEPAPQVEAVVAPPAEPAPQQAPVEQPAAVPARPVVWTPKVMAAEDLAGAHVLRRPAPQPERAPEQAPVAAPATRQPETPAVSVPAAAAPTPTSASRRAALAAYAEAAAQQTPSATTVFPPEPTKPAADEAEQPMPRTRRERRMMMRQRAAESPVLSRLTQLGLPESFVSQLPTDPTTADLAAVLGQLPRASSSRPDEGEVIAILVEPGEADSVGARIARRWRMQQNNVAGAGGATRLSGEKQAARLARQARESGDPQLLILDAELNGFDAEWAFDVLNGARPDRVLAVVDATRKPKDIDTWLTAITGMVDAVILVNTTATATPAAVLNLGIPVSEIDGRPGTATEWANLLMARVLESEQQ